MDGLRHMIDLHLVGAGEIADGASDLEHPVIGPRRQPQPRNRLSEERLGSGLAPAPAPHLARRHLRVGAHAGQPAKPVRWRARAAATRARTTALASPATPPARSP